MIDSIIHFLFTLRMRMLMRMEYELGGLRLLDDKLAFPAGGAGRRRKEPIYILREKEELIDEEHEEIHKVGYIGLHL